MSAEQSVHFEGHWKHKKQRHEYRQASTRLEHFKWVDNPLVVRAQQRTNVLARRIAQPLGHTSPASFLTHHLKTSFICHNLERTNIFWTIVKKSLVNQKSKKQSNKKRGRNNVIHVHLRQAEKVKDASFNMWDFQGGCLDLPKPGNAVQVIKLHSGLRLK